MSDSTEAILRQAHELIERSQLVKAQEVLAPLLESESENPALWWVYSHAVTDSGIGIAALERVLQLDPTYPGARELREEMLAARGFPDEDIDAELVSPSAQSSFLDTDKIDDWEAIQPGPLTAESNRRIGMRFVLPIAALLIAATGAALVLSGAVDITPLTSLFSQPTNQPIIVVSGPTEEPEATASTMEVPAAPESIAFETEPTLGPTVESLVPASQMTSPTTEAAATVLDNSLATTVSPEDATEFIELVAAGITDFPIDIPGSGLRETNLGHTIIVLVCAEAGGEFNQRLNAVMNAAVSQRDSFPDGVMAFAVSLTNCGDPQASVNTIGVPRRMIDGFATEEIDAKSFQQSWRRLDGHE